MGDLRATTIVPILNENIAREARLLTDEAHRYKRLGRTFAEHGVALRRYMAEFDFRYCNRTAIDVDDAARAQKALRGVVGGRLQGR